MQTRLYLRNRPAPASCQLLVQAGQAAINLARALARSLAAPKWSRIISALQDPSNPTFRLAELAVSANMELARPSCIAIIVCLRASAHFLAQEVRAWPFPAWLDRPIARAHTHTHQPCDTFEPIGYPLDFCRCSCYRRRRPARPTKLANLHNILINHPGVCF